MYLLSAFSFKLRECGYAISKLDIPLLLHTRIAALLGGTRDTVAHTRAAGGVIRLLRQFQRVFSHLPGRGDHR